MRLGKAVGMLLITGLFLLLLSALVVTPSGEAESLPAPILTGVRLLPVTPPVTGGDNPCPLRSSPLWNHSLAPLPCLLFVLLLPRLSRDANGRVLQAGRYENCFYQLFRQEVAGG